MKNSTGNANSGYLGHLHPKQLSRAAHSMFILQMERDEAFAFPASLLLRCWCWELAAEHHKQWSPSPAPLAPSSGMQEEKRHFPSPII